MKPTTRGKTEGRLEAARKAIVHAARAASHPEPEDDDAGEVDEEDREVDEPDAHRVLPGKDDVVLVPRDLMRRRRAQKQGRRRARPRVPVPRVSPCELGRQK